MDGPKRAPKPARAYQLSRQLGKPPSSILNRRTLFFHPSMNILTLCALLQGISCAFPYQFVRSLVPRRTPMSINSQNGGRGPFLAAEHTSCERVCERLDICATPVSQVELCRIGVELCRTRGSCHRIWFVGIHVHQQWTSELHRRWHVILATLRLCNDLAVFVRAGLAADRALGQGIIEEKLGNEQDMIYNHANLEDAAHRGTSNPTKGHFKTTRP